LRTPIPDAEKLKQRAGCAFAALVDEEDMVEVPSIGGRAPRNMPKKLLAEVLQPHAEDVFHHLWDEIRRSGYEHSLNAGVVLTGGGSKLEGMAEIAEQIFDLPIRRGFPDGVGGLADHVQDPSFATAVGLAMYVNREGAEAPQFGLGIFSGWRDRFGRILRDFF
jgi:cell division protein FtsA